MARKRVFPNRSFYSNSESVMQRLKTTPQAESENVTAYKNGEPPDPYFCEYFHAGVTMYFHGVRHTLNEKGTCVEFCAMRKLETK